MGRKWKLVICITSLLIILGLPTEVHAHGVVIKYTSDIEIEIVATYDTGEPMDGAQVLVYAPDDPSTPWLTGVCDDKGHFTFTPDTSKPGIWDVKIRQAGHGGIIHIPVGEDAVATGSSGGGYSGLQIVLMAACVTWGIIGTALYLSSRKTARKRA
ncbi:hypothetical protein ES703_00418 [subsurface metagenome]